MTSSAFLRHDVILDEQDDEKGDHKVPDRKVGLFQDGFLSPSIRRLFDPKKIS